MVADVIAVVFHDAGIARLAALVEAPVVEPGDHLVLVNLLIQAAVGVGAGVVRQLVGQGREALLGGVAVLPGLEGVLGLLLLAGLQLLQLGLVILGLAVQTGGVHLEQNVAHVHGVVIVAGPAVEHQQIDGGAVFHDLGVALLATLVKHPLGGGIAAVGAGFGVGIGADGLIVLGRLGQELAALDLLQGRVGGVLGLLQGSGALLLGGLDGVAVGVLGGGGCAVEGDHLIVGHVEGVLVLLIVLLELLVGIRQAVDVVLLIVGGDDGILQDALEDLLGHVAAVELLEVLALALTGGLGIGGQGLHGGVQLLLHVVVPGDALLGSALLEHGDLDQALLGGVLEIGVPGHVLGHAQQGLGHVAEALLGQGGGVAQAVIGGILVLGNGVIGHMIEIADLGGGIGFALHGDGGGAPLDHVGVPHQQHSGHQHEHNGNTAIEPVVAALLGPLLRLAGGLGVHCAAGVEFLAGFLFSGCTHSCFSPLENRYRIPFVVCCWLIIQEKPPLRKRESGFPGNLGEFTPPGIRPCRR